MSQTHDSEDQLPHLGADQLEDEQDLAEVVDAVVLKITRTDPGVAATVADISLLEAALREVLGPVHWPLYTRLEELRNARSADLFLALTRWAFSEGVRHGCRHGEEP